jgi:hypothetical protein
MDRPIARIEHEAPGRIRVRLGREDRVSARMEPLAQGLTRHPAVDAVRTNLRTGSILVMGNPMAPLRQVVSEFLEVIQEEGPERLPTAGVQAVVALVKEVDGRIVHATGGRLSLRWLVPAIFVSMGVRQLLTRGLTLGTVPWYVLIYYGVDSFLKLYPEYAPSPAHRYPSDISSSAAR